MKNFILTSLAIFFSYAIGLGQISIVSSDLPKAGDTIRYSVGDPMSISNFESTGANYTWDFSKLSQQRQELFEYTSALKTPYAFYFFGLTKFGILVAESLNLGVVQLTNVYDFYDNTSSAYLREGMGITFSGIPVPSYYTNKDEVYQFPLNFSDRDSSTFHFTVNLATLATYSTSGYRINEVDGWGKITTPYGTFDCIRVKTTLSSNDTVVFSGFPIGFPNNSVEYKWLAKNQKFPILEIKGTDGPGGFVASEVNYRDIYRNVYDPTAVVADFSASDLNPYTNDTVSFMNQSQNALPLSTYTWSFTPATIDFVNGTDKNTENPDVVFKNAGKYSVMLEVVSLTSSHDTTKTDYITVTNPPSGIESDEMKKGVIIYPNPVKDKLTVSKPDYLNGKSLIHILNLQGKLFYSLQFDEATSAIDVSSLQPGVYYLQIITAENTAVNVFIKE